MKKKIERMGRVRQDTHQWHHHVGTGVRTKGYGTGHQLRGGGKGATKREGGHVQFHPYEKGWGGGAEKVLAILKGGGEGQKKLLASFYTGG